MRWVWSYMELWREAGVLLHLPTMYEQGQGKAIEEKEAELTTNKKFI